MKGLAPNNPANDPDKKPVKGHSHFKPNFSVQHSDLFGLINATYAAQVVPDDRNFSIRCNSDIDTFSLKAPVMTPVKHNKAYFYVPRRAVLPLNADLYTTNPLTGEDITPPSVAPVLLRKNFADIANKFAYQFGLFFKNYASGGTTPGAGNYNYNQIFAAIVNFYQLGSMWFSDASLLNRLGISMHKYIYGPRSSRTGKFLSFDRCLEACFSYLRTYFKYAEFQTLKSSSTGTSFSVASTYTIDFDLEASAGWSGPTATSHVVSLRQALEILRETPACYFTITPRTGLATDPPKYVPTPDDVDQTAYPALELFAVPSDRFVNNYDSRRGEIVNLDRLISYQLTCVQWFTNDSVDYVYSCDLWHQNMFGLLRSTGLSYSDMYYSLNGLDQRYDSISGELLQRVFEEFYSGLDFLNTAIAGTYRSYFKPSGSSDDRYSTYRWLYFVNIFEAQRSLRFRDYFIGAKKRPMAVGDVDVQVNASKVNVVDVTKNIQMQRFLNQVNRLGRTLKEFSEGIFGVKPMNDPHEVIFLGSTSEAIGAEETSNTGAAQLSEPQTITSHFRNQASRFAFEFSVPEFGTIIGVTYFDCARPYLNTTDRETMHLDRFDDFNPYLQHIGDQEVYGCEIDPWQTSENYGYQLRYAEYKQRTDRAVGGFRDFLPGYAFLADDDSLRQPGQASIVISPDIIRARPSEFDKFYISLTNFSPAGYFHFIIRDDFEVNVNRPMEAAPSIL